MRSTIVWAGWLWVSRTTARRRSTPKNWIIPEARYEDVEVALGPGDRLFLYSDGIVDAQDESEQEFGQRALLETLAAAGSRPLQEAVDSTLAAVERHVGSAGRKDDLTLLGVELR